MRIAIAMLYLMMRPDSGILVVASIGLSLTLTGQFQNVVVN